MALITSNFKTSIQMQPNGHYYCYQLSWFINTYHQSLAPLPAIDEFFNCPHCLSPAHMLLSPQETKLNSRLKPLRSTFLFFPQNFQSLDNIAPLNSRKLTVNWDSRISCVLSFVTRQALIIIISSPLHTLFLLSSSHLLLHIFQSHTIPIRSICREEKEGLRGENSALKYCCWKDLSKSPSNS